MAGLGNGFSDTPESNSCAGPRFRTGADLSVGTTLRENEEAPWETRKIPFFLGKIPIGVPQRPRQKGTRHLARGWLPPVYGGNQ
jgi:hypothetical protein